MVGANAPTARALDDDQSGSLSTGSAAGSLSDSRFRPARGSRSSTPFRLAMMIVATAFADEVGQAAAFAFDSCWPDITA